MTKKAIKKVDPVAFELIKNTMVAAVHEASTLLEKVAYHPVANLGRDRTSGLLTPEGNLICHGHTDCAPHYGTLEVCSKELLKDVPASTMKPGDAYFFNDPIRTGRHVNDEGLHRPIFYKGKLVAFALIVLHWADAGGPMPGSFNPTATEAYAEGIRTPPIKIIEKNKIIEPIWNLLALNIRGSKERRADFEAEFRAVRLIEERFIEMCDKYGVDAVQQFIPQFFDYSEGMLRREVEQLPEGEYEFEDFGDQDIGLSGLPPIMVHNKLTIKDGTMTFDYSKSGPAPRSSWGSSRTTAIAGTLLGTMCCFPHLFPINHGILRSINIITKPGTCVHVEEPGATSGYCSGCFDKCESTSLGCLAQPLSKVKPHRVYPNWLNLCNLCIGGTHPDTGRQFVQYTWAMGGGGARTFKDGPSFASMRFIAFTNTIPMELEERWFPILYKKFEVLPNSGGQGKFRGGCGLEKRAVLLGSGVLTIHGDREKFPPYGIGGGTNGRGGYLRLNVGTTQERDLGMYATGIKLVEGDEFCFGSSGGGGYGHPSQRDPELVLQDVIDGYMTLQGAREAYGVSIKVIDEDMLAYEIDWDETKKLKAELSRKRIPEGLGAHEVNPQLKNIEIIRELSKDEALEDCALVRPPGW